ncbi:MAG: hypothetical protein GX663_01175 [Clostridiales bacterium]|nr:hypothetical protein [Clostridiales bacterium]
MISILPTHITSFRAFGWVQDPSNLRSLCDVVAIFDETSKKHKELIDTIIPSLVEQRDGRELLIDVMNTRPLLIPYSMLVGTSFTPRKDSRCNGIVQATVKGQSRDFIGDWPADNFVRWAHAFGFIKYSYSDDAFSITSSGLELTKAKEGEELSEKEIELLTKAVLAYPPAVRILNLLAETENTHLTKFELGRNLGFIGEGGFTSLPQSILIRSLATTESASEKNKMKADWDGSSDKYARMISKWLCKLGLVEQLPKEITVSIGTKEYTEVIGQAYIITGKGIAALRKTIGNSKHKRIAKNVCFEMFATKGSDREYLRTRRSYILKFLSESKEEVSVSSIMNYLSTMKIEEVAETIDDDIKGLINIGLNIIKTNTGFLWADTINDFIIPVSQNLAKSSLAEIKDEIRPQMTHLSHEYLSLIDLAYDSVQNRLFEMKTLELLTEECKFTGLHLGGSRKPDGIIYTNDLTENYGVIVDTKAYSKGYNLPISQADEMERYIRENQTRDKKINSNEWWLNFNTNIETYYFMFVAGHFIGNFVNQLERISMSTGVYGTALSVKNMLICANAIKSGDMCHEDMKNNMFHNSEYQII